ncbi:MAG: purine-nucleoside phosphorylase [Acidobacteriaceae bacterium]
MSICAFSEAVEAAAYVRNRTKLRPKVAVVLGSGLGGFGYALDNLKHLRFSEIPHFPVSTVYGHGGQMGIGAVDGTAVAVMQGRVHAYEGFKASSVVFPLRMLRQFGVEKVILTNAAGGIREGLTPGDLVLISDHINMSGLNPLAGPNDERFGPRFIDMTDAYSPRLRALAQTVAKAQGFAMKEGVYMNVLGPSFETPAEIRAFRTLGADLVGMSTVHETVAARHMGMEVLAISCVTNLAAGLGAEPLSHEEVLVTGGKVEEKLQGLLKAVIPRMVEGGAQ